jgi:hypothetical protein
MKNHLNKNYKKCSSCQHEQVWGESKLSGEFVKNYEGVIFTYPSTAYIQLLGIHLTKNVHSVRDI